MLPTFGRPHLTLMLPGVGDVDRLLGLLGPERANPHYGETTGRRRR